MHILQQKEKAVVACKIKFNMTQMFKLALEWNFNLVQIPLNSLYTAVCFNFNNYLWQKQNITQVHDL